MSAFLLEMLLSNDQQIVETFCESLTGPRTPGDRAREAVWQIRRNVPEVMAGDLIGYAGFDKRDEVGGIAAPSSSSAARRTGSSTRSRWRPFGPS
ncbi:hypothetical protein [Actinomadura welshii]|uniref:hypothetical protein n=1 Tax=Actinomadura welshii TaxID=3103817 RepID=UPI0003ACF47B|nr:hypothetical protein [Actinomadura madurae]